ncbi:MAG: pyridoxal phosphate-dependent aminotransferase [Candidatus Carbobacillus altaicus]|nr:pyridoxal phosphate-dependent aminotransferase [Candidatus Carbobacillus altaicus]
MKPLAMRVRMLAPSPTLAITARANAMRAEGKDVLSLGAGEPDFNTPDVIIEAAYRSMKEGKTKYTPSGGIPPLREVVARELTQTIGKSYAPGHVHIASGAKQALYNVFQAIVQEEEEVIIPVPYWVSYPEQVKLSGGIPVLVPTTRENGYKLTPEVLRGALSGKTRALILNSPSNPTGSLYTERELALLAEVLEAYPDVWIVSDEIYRKLIYEGEHTSIASLSDALYARTIVIDGVSKPYAMTGWRIGWAASTDRALIEALDNLSSQSTSNPTTFAQYGALHALTDESGEVEQAVQRMVATYRTRRDTIVPKLMEIPGFWLDRPPAAFYVYIDISEALKKSGFQDVDAWAEALLEEEGVAVVPGTGFGTLEHIRISYATDLDTLNEAITRMRRFVEKRMS